MTFIKHLVLAFLELHLDGIEKTVVCT